MIHPDDENGDVLRRLEAKGDDLSRPRDVNFSVIFPNEEAALDFALVLRKEGYAAKVEYAQVEEEHPWDVTIVKHMIPTHEGITEFERELEEVAEQYGGHNDGWGCFSQPGKYLQ